MRRGVSLAPARRPRRYEVGEAISAGASGAVHRGRDVESGTEVALKRLLDTGDVARLEIEARLLSALEHPRIVSVLDHFVDGTGAYLVMDLVRGVDLEAELGRRGTPGLPVEEVVALGLQACEALAYIHREQVVHRDVKPANLILGEAGVVLVDFGIARDLEDQRGRTVGIGTPYYIAPEVLAGYELSPRSDVFGLSATLWTLLAGRPPAYGEATPLSELAPSVSPALEATLQAGLELNSERRLPSAEVLAERLGAPLEEPHGASLARSAAEAGGPYEVLEAIVRTAAGVFGAAASSVALLETGGSLRFEASWGAGAREVVGLRLGPGVGIAGAVAGGEPGLVIPDCRADPRFAAAIAEGTGYVPHTMIVVPLLASGRVLGVLYVLDRRDGRPFRADDVTKAELFADLAVTAMAATQEGGGGSSGAGRPSR